MDTAVHSASALPPTERLFNLMGCAVTAIFVLSGIDLHAIARGGLWLRDLTALIAPQNHA